MSGLRGKVVLITGASSGIGYATALHLSSLGAQVVATGRKLDRLEALRTECLAAYAEADILILTGDVSVDEDLQRMVETTKTRCSRLDVLVNNAAVLESGTIENTSLEQYDTMMNTNLKSAFRLSQLCIPLLAESQGNIVNVSSIAANRSFPGILAYSASKAGMDSMTQCMALELAARKIRVNAVNPGVIITDIHRRSGMGEEQYQRFLERCCFTHALGRPGTAHEVATVIAFLADETRSSFMTGNIVPVDGGRQAMVLPSNMQP